MPWYLRCLRCRAPSVVSARAAGTGRQAARQAPDVSGVSAVPSIVPLPRWPRPGRLAWVTSCLAVPPGRGHTSGHIRAARRRVLPCLPMTLRRPGQPPCKCGSSGVAECSAQVGGGPYVLPLTVVDRCKWHVCGNAWDRMGAMVERRFNLVLQRHMGVSGQATSASARAGRATRARPSSTGR
jgi:hypothetical protein